MMIRNCLACLLAAVLLALAPNKRLFAEEGMKTNIRQLTGGLPIDGFCWHPSGQEIIFSSRDWIYSVGANGGQIKKLIPGRCPQWVEGGKRFIYFLDAGYDGDRCELWSAGPCGEARLRLCQKDFFIDPSSSPVVSPNGNMIAFLYSCCMAAGGFEEIRLIVFEPTLNVNTKSSARILLVAPFGTNLDIIGWLDNSHLAVARNKDVVVLDPEQVEWAPTDDNHEDLGISMDEMGKRFERLKTSSVGVVETSYQELSQKQKIPYNCEISQDGQWVAYVEHMKGNERYRNKLFVRKLADEEKSIMICEDVSPPRYYGLPKFEPTGLKMVFIKWSGYPRYYSGDLWMIDLEEVEVKR